jgi:hypothetical protein
MNLAIKINLTRIPGAIFSKLTGKTGIPTDCIIIPVDSAGLFRGEKGIYLDATALEFKEQKYADSHFIKMSVPKEIWDTLTDEQKNAIPIIGGLKPIQKAEMQPNQETDFSHQPNDLPF